MIRKSNNTLAGDESEFYIRLLQFQMFIYKICVLINFECIYNFEVISKVFNKIDDLNE